MVKKCFVPTCPNNWRTTPTKLFIRVRDCLKESWCQILKINYNANHVYYCCEDHLNLEEDLENYLYWKLMKGRPILKSTATLKLNTTESIIKLEELEDEEYCELVESADTKPIIEVLDISNEESPRSPDPLAVNEPPAAKYLKTLENFRLQLYDDVKVEETEKNPQKKPEKRKQTVRCKPDDMNKGQSLTKTQKFNPPSLLFNSTIESGITGEGDTESLTLADITVDSAKHEAPVLYNLLVSEDTVHETAYMLDLPRRPLFVSVGVQCRVYTRDACVGFNGRKNLPIGFKKPAPSLVQDADGTDMEVLDLTEPCSCCLFRPSCKYLNTSYTDDERTETYRDMLQDCFGIQLKLDNDECGICDVCVGRLRDACDFRLQVRRSQERLRARLGHPTHDEALTGTGVEEDWLEGNETLDEEPTAEEPVAPPEIIVRGDGLYECPICHKTLKREAGLKSHMLVHCQQLTQETRDSSEPENSKYTCDECGSEFINKKNYNRHMKTHEVYNPDPSEVNEEIQDESNTHENSDESSEDSESDDCEYVCHLCGNEFRKKRNYVRHLEKHESTFKCDICPREFFTESYLVQHKSRHAGEMYICDMCKKKFYDKNQLSVHIALHMNMKPHYCKVCKKRYKDKYTRNMHELSHIKDKKYRCEVCNKRFGHELLLERHERVHKNRCIVCENCGKQFLQINSLIQHQRTHTGEKPFQCNICQMRFSKKDALTKHYRRHTGERPYSCDICSKKFTAKSCLKNHKRIHSGEKPYSCQICERKFSIYDSLRLHLLVHTGERRHCCDKCGKKFGRKKYLNYHLLTHMERTYYSCPHCPKVYSHKHSFANHLRNHAKGLI